MARLGPTPSSSQSVSQRCSLRTITAAQSAVLDSGNASEHVRVSVKDSGGTFRDLTTYPGVNLLDSCSWQEDLDSPHATAEIVVKREIESLSLAPLMQASALNRGFNPAASYAALLALAREVKIEVAICGADAAPASGDWMEVFRGYVDTIDPASGAQIRIGCRDLGAAVADRFIETERVQSYGQVSSLPVAMRIWEPLTAYALNEYILPATRGLGDSGNAKFYKVTTAGTSAAGEPTWPAVGTVADGSVVHGLQAATSTSGNLVEKVIQNLLDDNLGGVTLYVPSASSWSIRQYKQQREPLLEAIRNLAMQIGWDVRYRWRESASAFQLTFSQPSRSSPSVDRTFGPSDYVDFSRLAQDVSGIRNVVRVIYPDRADTWPDGSPIRKVSEASDSTSITAYGRRFMEIAEDNNSNIDSSTEAAAMRDAALADLKDPVVEASVEMAQGFPWVQLGDYYSFTADDRHFSTTQSLAVFSVSHEAAEGHIKTSMQLRGKPSIGYDRWLEKSAHPEENPNHELQSFQAAAGINPSVTPIIGGLRVTIDTAPDKLAHVEEFEHHVSLTNGFTPSSSTLKETSKARSIEIVSLNPGTIYYYKCVARTRNAEKLIRSQPSAQITATAGRGVAGHVQTEVEWGRLPLNGGFEASHDGVAADHWIAVNGAWGSQFIWESSSDAITGVRRLKLVNSASQSYELESDWIEAEEERDYFVTCRSYYDSGGSHGWDLYVEFYDSSKSLISSSSALVLDNQTSWQFRALQVTTVGDTKYIKLSIRGDNGVSPRTAYVDDIRVGRTPDYWYDTLNSVSPSNSTSSSTWANIFSQSNDLRGGQPVVIVATGTCHADGAGTGEFRAVFGGSNQTAYLLVFSAANVDRTFSYVWIVNGSNNAGGSVTIQLQWRSPSGSTLIAMASDNNVTMAAWELNYGRG